MDTFGFHMFEYFINPVIRTLAQKHKHIHWQSSIFGTFQAMTYIFVSFGNYIHILGDFHFNITYNTNADIIHMCTCRWMSRLCICACACAFNYFSIHQHFNGIWLGFSCYWMVFVLLLLLLWFKKHPSIGNFQKNSRA